jgi:hypothetical protein
VGIVKAIVLRIGERIPGGILRGSLRGILRAVAILPGLPTVRAVVLAVHQPDHHTVRHLFLLCGGGACARHRLWEATAKSLPLPLV